MALNNQNEDDDCGVIVQNLILYLLRLVHIWIKSAEGRNGEISLWNWTERLVLQRDLPLFRGKQNLTSNKMSDDPQIQKGKGAEPTTVKLAQLL